MHMSNLRDARPLPLLLRVPDRDAEAASALNELGAADALLLEWGDEPRGLFHWLSAAALVGRTLLPARWLPVRPLTPHASLESGRLLWVARSDAALRRLFAERPPDPLSLSGSARPDEPFALLGVPGDAITHAATDPFEIRRRAELWLHRLGTDRVAVALTRPNLDQPLAMLARRRRLPLLHLQTAEAGQDATLEPSQSAWPLLQTDFQLDAEHRLPDEHYIPSLRDLLHRGSLLRERTLFERLPLTWRLHCEAELRALYAWQLSPLLRRAGALLQTFLPLADVQLRSPLPRTGGVVAYLLGLSAQRPDEGVLAADASGIARHLVGALQAWDRHIEVEIEAMAWPLLGSRLSPWAEAGNLAACEEETRTSDSGSRRLCFSGQPLSLRTTLRRNDDGLPLAALTAADRPALGWFELTLRTRQQGVAPTLRQGAAAAPFPFVQRANLQLPLQLEGMTA
jgi:hypothetical protein